MRFLTPEELTALGNRFGVPVDGTEADAVCSEVNSMLDGLDRIDDLPLAAQDDQLGDRTWHEPTTNPYNAIAVSCHVPPEPDHSGELEGYTVALKDIIAVSGIPMQCSSAVMRGFVPTADATVTARIRAAGGLITAMTQADEFAASAKGTTTYRGPIRNPHDPERTAGGSSGGSAAAVANRDVDLALGTDTGGSIRIPAAFCGIVGLKPTYGLVPLTGVVENTYSQDHVGPMTRTVADAARLLAVLAGPDESDPASLQAAGRPAYETGGYHKAVQEPPALESLTLGVLLEGFGDQVARAVEDQTRAALEHVEDAGATVREVTVPEFDYGAPVKDAVSFTEVAAHWRDAGAPVRRGGLVDESYQAGLASRTSRAGELGINYKAKILAGARLLEANHGRLYTRAQLARDHLRRAFDGVLADVDAIAMPTMPEIAPLFEEVDEPGFEYGRNTRIADATRLPAITIPNGTVDGMPVGLQFMAGAFEERSLLGTAARVEATVDTEV